MMPLCAVKGGDIAVIKKITGKDDIRRHLAEMGFVVGERVTVISEMGGSMILGVKGCRVALDKNMAMRILV